MSRFTLTSLPIAGVRVVERRVLQDSRGFFSRLFCAEELAMAGWRGPVAQINHTLTRQAGSVRGLHFQRPPHAETKLVSCLAGEVWDVVVDLRRESPTYLQWHAQVLSADNRLALLIPEGVAHGFQTLSADAQLLYLHSHPHAPEAEDGLNPMDERLAIAWPQAITMMSERDRQHPLIAHQPERWGLATPNP
jgi:dTDP-4-dehydrorhamnose 3,5-epimerase